VIYRTKTAKGKKEWLMNEVNWMDDRLSKQ
jgi:hypothetical protein